MFRLYSIVAIGLLFFVVGMLGVEEVNAGHHEVKIGVLHSLSGTMAISETLSQGRCADGGRRN